VTCAVSGLPIEPGDKLRFLLLTENPFTDSHPCSMNDNWIARTYPLCGTYDDYGKVCDVTTGSERDVWLEGLTYDVVPRGWGDNSVHDVPVQKRMTWDKMLEAIHERRLRVRDRAEDPMQLQIDQFLSKAFRNSKAKAQMESVERSINPKRVVPKGVPTRARIEKVLVAAGVPLTGGFGGGFMVTKRRFGEVKIRFSHGDDTKKLEELLPHLTEYATMICAGEGNYRHNVELLVRPKPGVEGYYGHHKDKCKSLLVQDAMIREDVWQALLQLPINDSKDKRQTISEFYLAIDEYFVKARKRDEGDDLTRLIRQKSGEVRAGGIMNQIKGRDSQPFVLGLGTHWYLLEKKGPLTREFLRTAAEFAYLHILLSNVHYFWQPTYYAGQHTEWGLHRRLFETLAKLAQRKQRKVLKDFTNA